MIYFMQSVGGGPIKIGYSDKVESRRGQLEAHYGRELAVIAVIEGGTDEEKSIHERFKHLRYGRTEQFQPAPELLEFVGRPELADDACDAIEEMGLNPNQRRHCVRLMMTDEFKDWLVQYSEFRNLSLTDAIIQDVLDKAAERGFKPPPRR